MLDNLIKGKVLLKRYSKTHGVKISPLSFNRDGAEEPERDSRDNGSPDISSDGLKNVNSEDGLIIKATNKTNGADDVDIEEYILQGAVPKHLTEGMNS